MSPLSSNFYNNGELAYRRRKDYGILNQNAYRKLAEFTLYEQSNSDRFWRAEFKTS